MKTVNVTLKKKTILNAVNQLEVLNSMELSKHREGDPIYELVKEVKRDVKRQMRQPKINHWKEFFDFWPLSIVCPLFLIMLMYGVITQ